MRKLCIVQEYLTKAVMIAALMTLWPTAGWVATSLGCAAANEGQLDVQGRVSDGGSKISPFVGPFVEGDVIYVSAKASVTLATMLVGSHPHTGQQHTLIDRSIRQEIGDQKTTANYLIANKDQFLVVQVVVGASGRGDYMVEVRCAHAHNGHASLLF